LVRLFIHLQDIYIIAFNEQLQGYVGANVSLNIFIINFLIN